jgi:NADH-quinone oxidoreductase subunit H
MLCVTLIIAAITLIERKILALIQRRVGPYYVGYRGRLQYIADALKLFVKGIILPDKANKFWFVFIPALAGAICYTFWVNSVWGANVSFLDIEYNIVYMLLLSICFSFCILLAGYFSKNKYAMLASIRCCILTLNIEIFLNLLVLNLVFLSESFCFSVFVVYQTFIWFVVIFLPVLGLVCITFLLETNRAPFDLAEAESELVTGYSVEYGGFYFALYYLGEYFHLFFCSAFFSIVLLGGWEFPQLFFLNFLL